MINWQEILRSKRFWQVLVTVKLAGVLGLWVMLDDGLQFGDRSILAASEKVTQEQKKDADPSEKKPETSEKAEASSKTEARTRKSFLANLLELPPLDPDTMKKDELGKYLEIAERKKRQVEERLSMLKGREDQLKALESSIDEKLKRLDEERKFFAQTIQQEKNLKGERLDRLVQSYAKMEPKKAAPVMEKLDKDLVVDLFKAIPQKQVTAILEAMSPDKSVIISEYYGRVRSTREYDVLKEMNQSLRKEFDDCKGMQSQTRIDSSGAP